MGDVHYFPRSEVRVRSPRRRARYFASGRVEPSPTRLWWFVDLFPGPSIAQPRSYRQPTRTGRVVAAFVFFLVLGFLLGATMTLAPNGDVIRAVLAEARKR